MWKPGDIVLWRSIFNNRVWHIHPTIVVGDRPEEFVLALLPGAEYMAEESYYKGKNESKRWWDFKDKNWQLAKYTWHTNRLLILLEPQKYYSTMYFWNGDSDEFLCYYMNFQLPFQRNHRGIDTLDLDLDLIINPDFSHKWKDMNDYQKAIDHGIIFPEWIQGIEAGKQEILEKLEKRQYPFDGSWLDWMPDPRWSPPNLSENWDKL